MRMLQAVGLAIFLAATIASGVAKADGAYQPSKGSLEPAASWSGPYIGLHAGRATTDTDYERNYPGFAAYGGRPSFDVDDWIIGGKAGLQQQFGTLVVGIEAWGAAGDFRQTAPPFGPGDFSNETIDIGSIITLTGRIGFVASNDLLIYAKGGYATANVENRLVTQNGSFQSNERENGWTVGAGLDYRVAPHVLVGAEYHYIDLGIDDRQYSFANNDKANLLGGDIEFQAITLNLTLLLNGAPTAAPLK